MPVVNKQLVGVEAIQYLASKYDWNVYVPDYNRMNIIAYRQTRDSAGNLTYNCAQEYMFTQELTIEWDGFISVALKNKPEDEKAWFEDGWVEYDSWEGDPEWVLKLYAESTPFAQWFEDNIVDYEIQ